jgi:SAM-dependent MidA family methyltransferase
VTTAIQAVLPAAGVIPFARFMELALYHPEEGYYERCARHIGRGGDFFTSVSVGCVFGELLAFRFAAWLADMTGPIQLVEAGAHDGRLAADVLGWFRGGRPDLFARLEYWVLEPSDRRRGWQTRTLAAFPGKVRWFADWRSVPAPGVNGVIFANELLDAFPVRRFGWDRAAQRWFEWGVAWANGTFQWRRLELPDGDTGPTVPASLLPALPDGYIVESCPAALDWWRAAAQTLRHGRLLTLDFGHAAETRFRAERPGGSLRAYYRHHLSDNLLACPGEQDLTADVDFGALQEAGERTGLQTDGFWRQGEFLARILADLERAPTAFAAWTPARLRQLRTLLHPEHLGHVFRVLQQTRT